MVQQRSNVKYHIGKNGIPRICRSVKKPCPYGGIGAHFTNVESAQAVADDLNQQLQRFIENKEFGVAVNGEYVMPTKDTEKAILQLQNFKYNLKQMDAILKKTKADIYKQLQAVDVKSLDTEIGKITTVKGSERKSVDIEALKDAGIYDDYLKSSSYSEYTQVIFDEETAGSGKIQRFKNKLNTYDGETLDLDLRVEGDEVIASEQTIKALEELRAFQETVDRAKALEKETKSKLMATMKEAKVNDITVGKTHLVYVPDGDRMIVDTEKLKDVKLYEQYTKTVSVAPGIRVKFS